MKSQRGLRGDRDAQLPGASVLPAHRAADPTQGAPNTPKGTFPGSSSAQGPAALSHRHLKDRNSVYQKLPPRLPASTRFPPREDRGPHRAPSQPGPDADASLLQAPTGKTSPSWGSSGCQKACMWKSEVQSWQHSGWGEG